MFASLPEGSPGQFEVVLESGDGSVSVSFGTPLSFNIGDIPRHRLWRSSLRSRWLAADLRGAFATVVRQLGGGLDAPQHRTGRHRGTATLRLATGYERELGRRRAERGCAAGPGLPGGPAAGPGLPDGFVGPSGLSRLSRRAGTRFGAAASRRRRAALGAREAAPVKACAWRLGRSRARFSQAGCVFARESFEITAVTWPSPRSPIPPAGRRSLVRKASNMPRSTCCSRSVSTF